MVPRAGVKSICRRVCLPRLSDPVRYVDQLGPSPDCVPDIFTFPMQMELRSLEHVSKPELVQAQRRDKAIERAVQAVQQQAWPEISAEIQNSLN